MVWFPGPGPSQSCQFEVIFTHLVQTLRVELFIKPAAQSLSSAPASNIYVSPFAMHLHLAVF